MMFGFNRYLMICITCFIIIHESDCVTKVGWPVVNRGRVDSNSGWTFVATDKPITCDGNVTEWTYYPKSRNPFRALIFRRVGGSRNPVKVVGVNVIPAGEINQAVSYTVPIRQQITVKAGDLIGLEFSQGVVSYNQDGDNKAIWDYWQTATTGNSTVGKIYDHPYSSGKNDRRREYSLIATIEKVGDCNTHPVGWPIKVRPLTHGGDWTLVALDRSFSCDGKITEWSYYPKVASPFRALVFRKVEGSTNQIKLVGVNEIPAGEIYKPVSYRVPTSQQITVKPCDMIGFEDSNAVIPYAYSGNNTGVWDFWRTSTYGPPTVDQIYENPFSAGYEPRIREYSLMAITEPIVGDQHFFEERIGKGASNEYVFTLLEPQSDEITGSTPYLLITPQSAEDLVVYINISGLNFNRVIPISTSEPYVNITLSTNVYLTGTEKQDKAIRIRSESRIFVYGAYTYTYYRASGFSVLPVSELGQTYYVASYTPYSSEYSEYSITSLDEQITDVEITSDSDTRSITLQPYESYQYKSSFDLTGTKITADHPISVMSGCSAARVESQSGGPEYMIQHIPPVKNLGTTYILAPFQQRSALYVVRVIATEASTSIFLNGTLTPERIDKPGEYIHNVISETRPYSIVADKPVMVVQYAGSHHTDSYGDTFMLIATPIRVRKKEDVSFPITTLQAASIVHSYLQITLNCDDIEAIRIDGDDAIIVDGSWTSLEEVSIESTSYCTIYKQYNHGVHHITTPGRRVPYEAIVYGFSQKYVAYAFTLWGLSVPATESQELQNIDATSISCENSQMVILLNSSYVMDGAEQEVHLLDPSCTGQSYVNNTIRLATDFDKCGTSMSVEEENLVFSNKLTYRAPRLESDVYLRYFSLSIDLSCTVPRRGNSSFGPVYGPIRGGESGSGHLKFSLDMYQNDQFTNAYNKTDFPIMINEGQQIFLAASVNDVKEARVSIEVCKVTPTSDPDDIRQRILLENGCGTYHPITFYESQESSQQRFSTQIDDYFTLNPVMYIHCSMIVCSINNTDLCPQTNTNCPATRPVRDIRSPSSLTRVTVSTAGPVEIRTTSHLENNSKPGMVIIVAVSLSLNIIGLIFLVILLKKLYTRYQTSYGRLTEVVTDEFEMASFDNVADGENFKYTKF